MSAVSQDLQTLPRSYGGDLRLAAVVHGAKKDQIAG
jgi:hypothetical protein